MAEPAKSKSPAIGHYDLNYGNFHSDVYAQIRHEAFGEDIGQNSWLTAAEQDRFIAWLELAPEHSLLDVACGSGGPALRIAARTGCSVTGIDVHQQAIAGANTTAAQRGLAQRAAFRVADASRLEFPNASFDAITCIDAINHLPDRPAVVRECARVLKPRGRLLFTDPITVTGALSNAEIAIRSSAGFYLFVPLGYDEEVIAGAGLRLLVREDVTANTAEVAARRLAARAARVSLLRQIEGPAGFDAEQLLLETSAQLARERRLSRFVFVAAKPA
jgi:2-polyprenyl-3-methyl-5-hydroxy-6-metoxy-1,4-benzoquinol methylase